jgi:hypothetical protein
MNLNFFLTSHPNPLYFAMRTAWQVTRYALSPSTLNFVAMCHRSIYHSTQLKTDAWCTGSMPSARHTCKAGQHKLQRKKKKSLSTRERNDNYYCWNFPRPMTSFNALFTSKSRKLSQFQFSIASFSEKAINRATLLPFLQQITIRVRDYAGTGTLSKRRRSRRKN